MELVPVSQQGSGVYSLYFLIPNKDGTLRPIPDLRPLNLYILSEHSHTVTLQDVIPLLQKGDYMTALDLKDAYFHTSSTSQIPKICHCGNALPIQSTGLLSNNSTKGVHQMLSGSCSIPQK
ncbi:hypothetical protein NDU88_000274, partial [Pleurodeles waltl]